MGWFKKVKRSYVGRLASSIGDIPKETVRTLGAVGGDTADFVKGTASSLSGRPQERAAKKGAAKQAAAAEETKSLLKEYLEQAREDQKPFYDIGVQNAQTLNGMVNTGGFEAPAFNYKDPGEFQFQAFDPSQVTNDPGYQLMMQEGTGGIQNMAAARGSLRSGGTLKALTRFKTGLASQEVGKAYDRFSNDRANAQNAWNSNRSFGYGQAADAYNRGVNESQNRFNRLSQLAGYGPGAAAQNNAAGGNYAQGAGNAAMGAANAQAAAGMYGANARAQGTQNMINLGGLIGGAVL